MNIAKFPLTITNWDTVETIERDGVTGKAISRIFFMGDMRIRQVDYSADFLADHWCHKGHVIYCIEGAIEVRMESGASFHFSKGMSCHMGDDGEAHRIASVTGGKILVVD